MNGEEIKQQQFGIEIGIYAFKEDMSNVSIFHKFFVYNSKNIPAKLKDLAKSAIKYYKEITGYDMVFPKNE